MLCIDKASTYRRFDIVIRKGLRTLIVSEGTQVATWNGFSRARSQGNMTQNSIFCQQKSVSPLNAKGYKSVTFPMDFHGFRAIYPGRDLSASANQAENYSNNSLPG